MKSSLALTIFVSFFILSCHSDADDKLDLAESNLAQRPDSSLVILESVSRSELNTEKRQSRYALLKSAAFDKNYIDVTSDSLTREAVDYYSGGRNKKYEMWAWYYHALVQMNAQSYTSSIVALEEAEKVARELNDVFQLGLIMRNKAKVFKLSNNNPSAIECRKQAIECFDLTDKTIYKAYAELDLCSDYINNQEYRRADSLLNHIREYNLPALDHYCNTYQAIVLVETEGDPERAIALYKGVAENKFSLLDYGYLATCYEAVSKPDSADYWLSKGYAVSRNQADSASIDYMRSKVELSRGHHEVAFRLMDHATTVQDSLTRVLLQQSISAAQRDYYKSETLRREEKIRMMRHSVVYGAILGCLLLLYVVMAGISLSRKKERLIKEQMARLALEEREVDRLNQENARLVGSLFSEKIHRLDQLCESYFKTEDVKEKELAFKQVRELTEKIRGDEGLFHSLEKDLDRYCNGIMSKLREQVPRIKGENLKLIMLFFAGFSYETIQLILRKNSTQSLRTARSRFRKEILDAGATDADYFIKMLGMKKRPQAGTRVHDVGL